MRRRSNCNDGLRIIRGTQLLRGVAEDDDCPPTGRTDSPAPAGPRPAAARRQPRPGLDPWKPFTLSRFRVSDRVMHPEFGLGVVLSRKANVLEIYFADFGEKHIIDAFVRHA